MKRAVIYLSVAVVVSFSLAQVVRADELPEWLKRIYYGLKIESDRKPQVYFETVQPVWKLKEDSCLVFTQPRITIKGGIGHYSLGLGYRQLVGLDKAILGFNIFYDYQDRQHHRQVGFGAEALGDDLEARINSYFGTSHERLATETATYFEYEEVVDGLDAEIGFRVPGLSGMKVFGGGYYYDADYADDLEGWKARLEIKPLNFLTIDIGVKDDNSSEERWFMELGLRIPFGQEDFSSKEEENVKKTLHSRMLDPVERNFIPTLEKWTSDRTGTVTGRILDQNGDPVINARVEIHSEVVTVYTDSNGEYSATVTVGNHSLYAWNSDGDQIITGRAITVTDGTTMDLGTENVDNPATNHAPAVSDIPNQTIDEDGTFVSINLDDYVSDSEHADNQIAWSYSGNTDITVSISSGRVASLTIPANWNGSEIITFTATDPESLSDSDSATFTVDAVNDAPVISNLTADPSTITGPPNKSWVSFDATDVDGDDITWSASITEFIPDVPGDDDSGSLSPPVGGTIQNGSGSKKTRYSAGDDGTVTVTVSLDDGNGGSDSESVNIVVDTD